MTQTFVYVIGPNVGPQKIGIAKCVKSRMDALQVGCPFDLNAHFVQPTPSEGVARKVEMMAHRLLRAQRQRGEWFNVTPARAIETVRGAMTAIPGACDDSGEMVTSMARAGVLSWDEYEAAIAYLEVRKVASIQGGGKDGPRSNVERVGRAGAILRRLEGEIAKQCSQGALAVLLRLAEYGSTPTREELIELRTALSVVAAKLEDATSAKAA